MGSLLKWAVPLFAALLAGNAAGAAIPVARGYDGRAFEYEMEPAEEQERFSLYRITYDSPAPEKGVDPRGLAWYYLPKRSGKGRPGPAVLCLHILGGDGGLTRMVAAHLAQRGIPAMMVVMPWFGERAARAGGRKNRSAAVIARAFRQTPPDVRRALDILASRPEADPRRLCLEGISTGAIFGAAVAGMDGRISRAALLLGGGGLKAILKRPNPETAPFRQAIADASPEARKEIEAAIALIEPLNWAGRLRGRARNGNILMINAGQDNIVPPENSRALAEAIGLPPGRHSWIDGVDHYGAIVRLPQILDRLSDYFSGGAARRRLPPPGTLTRKMCLRTAEILAFPTNSHLRAVIEGKTREGHAIRASVDFRRGAGERFRFSVRIDGMKLPFTRLLIGHDGRAAWFGKEGGALFYGTEGPEAAPPLSIPLKVAQYRLFLSGLLRIASMEPDTLKQLVSTAEKTDADGRPFLEIADRKGKIRVELHADTAEDRPRLLRIAHRDFNGTVTLEQCDFADHAPPDAFSPPGKTVSVNAGELARSVNAALAFLCR